MKVEPPFCRPPTCRFTTRVLLSDRGRLCALRWVDCSTKRSAKRTKVCNSAEQLLSENRPFATTKFRWSIWQQEIFSD